MKQKQHLKKKLTRKNVNSSFYEKRTKHRLRKKKGSSKTDVKDISDSSLDSGPKTIFID